MSRAIEISDEFARDVARIQSIEAVPKILDVICKATGMWFAAVARVSEKRWVCCAVRDDINFGLLRGGELQVETTICHEIRQHGEAVVISNVSESPHFCGHTTPAIYGFKSYISMPIFRKDGTFFGTLCAIDPNPAQLTLQIVETFALFSELIALQLEAVDRLEFSETSLANEQKSSELREQFIAVLGHDLRNPLASIAAGAKTLRHSTLIERDLEILDLIQSSVRRMTGLIENVMDFARGRLGSGLTLTKKMTSMSPLLEEVVSEIKSLKPDARFDMHMAVAYPVLCDSNRMQQLVSNLLGNAVTYGDLSKPIQILSITHIPRRPFQRLSGCR